MSLSIRQELILELVFRHIVEKGAPPAARSNEWFSRNSDMPTQSITDRKRELCNKGYLEILGGKLVPTQKADSYREALRRAQVQADGVIGSPFRVLSSQVRLQGTVRAGPLGPIHDGVRVHMDDLSIPSDEVITIPNVRLDGHLPIFALEVKGNSMANEGILEGDYIVVERWPSWRFGVPSPQEMIVTEYLPEEAAVGVDEVSPDEFVGPTVKIFEKQLPGKEYVLGWKRDNKGNPWKVVTRELRIVGLVIGVYRDFRKAQKRA